jgi:hypothetical protein
MAYLRLHKKLPFSQILDEFVDKQYYYETEKEMFRVNIVPVCMDTIAPDDIILPPRLSTKRASGRPKKKRIRKRPGNPDESRVKCSRCNRRGHNARTCEWMEAGEGDNDDDKKPAAVVQHELDLS